RSDSASSMAWTGPGAPARATPSPSPATMGDIPSSTLRKLSGAGYGFPPMRRSLRAGYCTPVITKTTVDCNAPQPAPVVSAQRKGKPPRIAVIAELIGWGGGRRGRLHPDPAAFAKHILWPASNRPLDGASPSYTAAPPSRISAGLLHLTDFARHGRHASLVLPYREPPSSERGVNVPPLQVYCGRYKSRWLARDLLANANHPAITFLAARPRQRPHAGFRPPPARVAAGLWPQPCFRRGAPAPLSARRAAEHGCAARRSLWRGVPGHRTDPRQ